MADRYLREALLNSERWNAISIDARDFYVRLILVCDDFGCYTGNEMMIRNVTYRYGRTQPVPLRELHVADLIVRYMNDGKPYIAVTQWGERIRRYRKYPAPPVFTDLPEIPYRGDLFTHRGMDWKNPARTDDVSVLLDHDLRPVAPQPPEWRRVGTDWMPITARVPRPAADNQAKRGASVGTSRSPRIDHDATTQAPRDAPHNMPTQAPRSDYGVGTAQGLREPPRTDHALAVRAVAVSTEQSQSEEPQSPTQAPRTDHATATATPTNGEIKLTDSGEWLGLSERQRLIWQEMFDNLSIPDALRDAAVWLIAHPKERAAYTARGELHAYLSRWLIRESKPRAPT